MALTIENIPLTKPKPHASKIIHDIEARNAAISKGLKRYIGITCGSCKGTLRYTKRDMCVKCHAEKQKNRFHASAELRENSRLRNKERWDKEKDRLNEERRQLHAADPIYKKSLNKKWRDANPDKMLLYNERHKKARIKANINWRKNNPEKLKDIVKRAWQNRRARKVKALGKITKEYFEFLSIFQMFGCYWCFEFLDDYEYEHIIPLAKGGTNYPDNVVLSCRACNAQKNSKLPQKWLEHPACRSRRILFCHPNE